MNTPTRYTAMPFHNEMTGAIALSDIKHLIILTRGDRFFRGSIALKDIQHSNTNREGVFEEIFSILTLVQLVANLAYTKLCKKP